MPSLFKNKKNVLKEVEKLNTDVKDFSSKLAAIDRSMAVIEFDTNGKILAANENFIATVGYSLNELTDQHHKIFCSPKYVQSAEYTEFWKKLNSGEFLTGEFERFSKSGECIWLEASYNPVFDDEGNIIKVIKFATDITKRTSISMECESIIDAIGRSMAVIEFHPNGQIIKANDNFLKATGYQLDEIEGQHHKIFCDEKLINSSRYTEFWNKLNRGEFVSGQFTRIDKSGNDLWLEASYNPIFGTGEKLIKVIKFASDITPKILAGKKAKQAASDTSIKADASAQKGSETLEEIIQLINKLTDDIQVASQNLSALNKQSDQINNIVKTISDIAEQTNLLALNAAIEAARAGEQGRGFAVVADEVRELAGRTSSATSEIAEVVKQNIELSAQANESMQASSQQVTDSVELIKSLSTTISEVNAGMSEIVSAIQNLDN